MSSNFKTTSNLTSNRKVYNRYYGDFHGVDFSSDHTQVHEQRLAYSVNMYKDYQSGQGQALETVAGFRRRVAVPGGDRIYGIHHYQYRYGGNTVTKILIHAGEKLYLWNNYPNTINVVLNQTVTLPDETSEIQGTKIFDIELNANIGAVTAVSKTDGEDITINTSYNATTHTLTASRSDLAKGGMLYVSYKEGVMSSSDALYSSMNTGKSTSFIFNNLLYIIDGDNYLVYNGTTVTTAASNAYIPTTYINIIPSGDNADNGTEYEQRNILQPKFKHTFIADGTTTVFYMNENQLEAVTEVKVYGAAKTLNTDYTVDLVAGKITFASAPSAPQNAVMVEGENGGDDVKYPEFYAGIEITAQKAITSVTGITDSEENIGNLITACTIATVFDNRVFMSGNPAYPNHIFYCGRNLTGYVDPTYFGVLNYMQDGVGIAPVTGMIPVADTLMVLKSDSQQDGSTYFHTASNTGVNLQPKVYPSSQGLSGIGCLGACTNFLDDPVFVSRLGLEAIGQLSVRYERAVEHRSSLVDAKLVNGELSNAVLEEWNGYLVLLVDGKIYLADSRQKYTHAAGTVQYEWYYLEDIGVWESQYAEYHYAERLYDELAGKKVKYCTNCHKGSRYCTCGTEEHFVELPIKLANSVYYADTDETKNLVGTVANPPGEGGSSTESVYDESVDVTIDGTEYPVGVYYTVHSVNDNITGNFVRHDALLCDNKGNYTGGVFKSACVVKSMENNLFFGTTNGVLCSFNFDKRGASGEIAPQYYTFDGRTIYCGCATKMDCCGIPHLTKNTVKKSTVVKTKSLQTSAAKIKVRTNKKPYSQIARINSTLFSFDNMDFSDFSFTTTDQSLFAVKEKEKKWVEKQYYIYSDEYMKPFALYYISFRYEVAGRYKE